MAGAFASQQLDAGTSWFYLDGSGNPTEQISGAPNYQMTSSDNCARQFNLDASGNPTTAVGQPVKGVRQN